MISSQNTPKEAIILAGGLGTRLRSVVADIPKAMALVNEKPFLQYILENLALSGFSRVVLSVGYKWESIRDYFGSEYKGMELSYAVEKEPLGTGGGIQLAFSYAKEQNVLVLNGDSLFQIELKKFFELHLANEALISLALKPMEDFDRYGTVSIQNDQRVTAFLEKKPTKKGFINTGVYVINRDLWKNVSVESKFSFEKDILERYLTELCFCGFVFDGYFIDIGIPVDYSKAQLDLPKL